MYHNSALTINKHVEAERGTGPAAWRKGLFPSVGHRIFQSKVDRRAKMSRGSRRPWRRWLQHDLILKRNAICGLKLDPAV